MTITIHHLHTSQSERIPWLCEELSIPYVLHSYPRAPLLAPPEYKSLHPSGTAPVIDDTSSSPPIRLAESAACVEYISRVHGGSRLFLSPDHPNYADFVYWWHWPQGTFMPALGRLMAGQAQGLSPDDKGLAMPRDRLGRSLRALEERFTGGAGGQGQGQGGKGKKNEWLAGDEFTVADIMVVFPLTTMRNFYQFSLEGYPGIVAYLGRIGEREAYKRAMGKSDPGMELALGKEFTPRGK